MLRGIDADPVVSALEDRIAVVVPKDAHL
jgi:hypothetical protein